ncbi:glycosyl transferase family protein [Diplocarpon rosae]|nr:glycosyl transferase family protein [Diplocarpon rosae]
MRRRDDDDDEMGRGMNGRPDTFTRGSGAGGYTASVVGHPEYVHYNRARDTPHDADLLQLNIQLKPVVHANPKFTNGATTTTTTTTTTPTRAWVTLLTCKSYIPGAVLLAHSLQKQHSVYPLIILYTPSLPHPASHRAADPPQQRHLIAARFEDTWTKLRIFELCEYERLVFLDADMLIRGNMDELFDLPLPGRDWIAANHCCVCNLDGDEWAPADWVPANCAYTGLTDPSCLSAPAPVPAAGAGPPTHALLNSGLFVCTPYAALWDEVRRFLATDPRVEHFIFPDQDLLAAFFRGRWRPLGYQYNALKTMRYWHPAMWRDDEVRNLHYIVDKPWRARVGDDGVAGYLGKDGETHRWWWREYERWEGERERMGERMVLEMVKGCSEALVWGGRGEGEGEGARRLENAEEDASGISKAR